MYVATTGQNGGVFLSDSYLRKGKGGAEFTFNKRHFI